MIRFIIIIIIKKIKFEWSNKTYDDWKVIGIVMFYLSFKRDFYAYCLCNWIWVWPLEAFSSMPPQ